MVAESTISDFKAAKESIFNVLLAFYIKNSKKTITGCGSLKLNFTFFHVIKI